ncbi:MAG: hypothetical protein M3O46_07560 [Myxococcota bacterium]|nr:hypothetical protein [Myxococcota bacterium]
MAAPLELDEVPASGAVTAGAPLDPPEPPDPDPLDPLAPLDPPEPLDAVDPPEVDPDAPPVPELPLDPVPPSSAFAQGFVCDGPLHASRKPSTIAGTMNERTRQAIIGGTSRLVEGLRVR